MEIQKERICIKRKGIKNPVMFKFNFCWMQFGEDYYIMNSPYKEIKRGVKIGSFRFLEHHKLIFTDANPHNCLEQTEVMKKRQEMQGIMPKYNLSREGLERQREGTRKYNEKIKIERRKAKEEINEMLGVQVFSLDR